MVALRAGLALLVLLACSPALATAEELTVEIADGTLSVTARDARLSAILLAIGERARARVRIESLLAASIETQRITGSFTRLPIEEGLRRLLKGQNFILGFGQDGVGEIRVFADGTTGFTELTTGASERGHPSKLAQAEAARRANEEARLFSPRPPDDLAQLARWRRIATTDRDPEARQHALEELQQIADQKFLVATLSEVMTRERDPDVVDRLLDVAEDHVPLLAASLRTVAASGNYTVDSRVRVLEMLGERDGADLRTRGLLRALSGNDGSARVRETAQTILQDLETPPARPVRTPPVVKPTKQ